MSRDQSLHVEGYGRVASHVFGNEYNSFSTPETYGFKMISESCDGWHKLLSSFRLNCVSPVIDVTHI
jgi:hypothetical protein